MDSSFKTQAITVLMVVFIIIVVIISIVALIIIWTPKDNVEIKNELSQESLQTGEYITQYITEEDMAKKYFSTLFSDLLSENYSGIYSNLDEDYISKTKYTIEDFSEMMSLRKIGGKNLVLSSYETIIFKSTRIYLLNISTQDNSIKTDVIVKETSPNQYKYSFDDIIFYNEEKKVSQVDDIRITYKNILFTTDEVVFNINIQNLTGGNIEINTNNLQENIYLTDVLGNLLTPSAMVLGGRNVVLENTQDVHLEAKYNLEYSQYNNLKNLLVKDIKFNNEGKVKDLEFEI